MVKLLKGLVYIMAIVGFAAVGYLVYLGFMKAKTDLLPGRGPVAAGQPGAPAPGVAGTAPEQAAAAPTPPPNIAGNPELSSIYQSYQKDIAPQAAGGATTTGSVSAQIAAARASKAAKTPGADTLIISKWPTGKKWVALTYDDGPHPEHTPKLLDLLAAKGVKATFFVLGPMVEKSPEVAQAIVQSGHEIANHTMTHPQFHGLAPEKVREEIVNANNIIKEVTGVEPRLMRPPYGQHPKKVQDVVRELNMKIIRWSVDTEDWKQAPEERMKKLIMDGLTDGAIILLHDTKGERIYNVTEQVIDEIRAKGFEFVTVGQMLGLQPGAPAPAPQPAAAPAAPAAGPAAGAAAAPANVASSTAAAPVSAATASASAGSAPAVGQGADAAPDAAASASNVPPVQRKLPAVSPDKLTTSTPR